MPNQLKRDPSRTTMLRNKFVRDMKRRFKKVSKNIYTLVVTDDAFGLASPNQLVLSQAKQIWRFNTSAQKVTAYRKWLQDQINQHILTPVGGISGQPWTAPYIESAYVKGVTRAYTDTNKLELAKTKDFYDGGQAQFLRDAFSGPVAQSKIELISTRVFEELRGVTNAMSQQMSRTLTNGLVQGHGANRIARDLRKNVAKITRTRANTLARTEIVSAHAEGQLDSFERLGVKEVGLRAEWITAGDDRVCPECGELEGVVMTIKEARGLIPRHPNCRCAWIPADKLRKEPGQLWGKKKDAAVARSIQAEFPKRSFGEAKRSSVWLGKTTRKIRPVKSKPIKPVTEPVLPETELEFSGLKEKRLSEKSIEDLMEKWGDKPSERQIEILLALTGEGSPSTFLTSTGEIGSVVSLETLKDKIVIRHLGSVQPGGGLMGVRKAVRRSIKLEKNLYLESTTGSLKFYRKLGFIEVSPGIFDTPISELPIIRNRIVRALNRVQKRITK